MSAACLLERYLEDKGRGSLLAPACSYPPPKDLEYFDYNLVKCHIRRVYFTQEKGDREILQHMPKFDNSLLDDKLMDYGVRPFLVASALLNPFDHLSRRQSS